MADPNMPTIPTLTLELLITITLQTALFAIGLGITSLLGYISAHALAFLLGPRRRTTALPRRSPLHSDAILFAALLTDCTYLGCCAVVWAYTAPPVGVFYVIAGGFALSTALIGGLLVGAAGLNILWRLLGGEVVGAVLRMTGAETGGRGETASRGR